jgi:hypothetical protein
MVKNANIKVSNWVDKDKPIKKTHNCEETRAMVEQRNQIIA